MRRGFAAVVACGAVACGAVAGSPVVAGAQTVAPQPGTTCAANLAGALTQLPDLTTLLRCDDRRVWRVVDDPYPHSDRWFTYGPTLTLHGEGQRNREIDSGPWTGYPQDDGSRCRASSAAIADAGGLTPPQDRVGEPGQPLRLDLPPLLFTIELSGYCLWQQG
ncbi:MAG TPA: hypothetical protein VHH12_09435 [Mycobacterium sp.]|nr:hypothetical protein [Mycobacterium sp.]